MEGVELVELLERPMGSVQACMCRHVPPWLAALTQAVLGEVHPVTGVGDGIRIVSLLRDPHRRPPSAEMRLQRVDDVVREEGIAAPPSAAVDDEPPVIVDVVHGKHRTPIPTGGEPRAPIGHRRRGQEQRRASGLPPAH